MSIGLLCVVVVVAVVVDDDDVNTAKIVLGKTKRRSVKHPSLIELGEIKLSVINGFFFVVISECFIT